MAVDCFERMIEQFGNILHFPLNIFFDKLTEGSSTLSDSDYTGFRADPCHFTKKAISYLIEVRFNITYVVNFLMGMHRHATRSHCWLVRPPIDPYGRLTPPVSFKIDSQVDQYQQRMLPKEEQKILTRRDI